MPTVTTAEMRELERAAMDAGWSERDLLESAGTSLGHAIGRCFGKPCTGIGYLGKGHNAGDVVVALSVLRGTYGWRTGLRMAFPPEQCAPLLTEKLEAFPFDYDLKSVPSRTPLVLLDGLLGIGASGPLRGPVRMLAREMNLRRETTGARVIAVDGPTGVNADTGEADPDAVVADATFMIAHAKAGLILGVAVRHTGSLVEVPVPALAFDRAGRMELTSPRIYGVSRSRRNPDTHKGQAGRVSLIVGSPDFPGAAVLAGTGALRAGAGLITLHVPEVAYQAVVAKAPPELIVRSYRSVRDLKHLQADAIGIGCGMGDLSSSNATALLQLISETDVPAVLDADALNLLAKTDRLDLHSENHILTPHPGEFARLAPELAGMTRETAARTFADRFPGVLLLKGARTIVTQRDAPLLLNPTGTPGMATGGQGDLLTGVIAALCASGLPPLGAAAQAAWLCGHASEMAIRHGGQSEESLTPSDTACHFGAAFEAWRAGLR